MAEYTEKRWRCNCCQRDVKRGVMPPARWHEAQAGYGNALHACWNPECEAWLREFCEENGIALPFSLVAKKTSV